MPIETDKAPPAEASTQLEETARAIANYLAARLPPLPAVIAEAEANPTGTVEDGPQVTLPVVFGHMLLSHLQALDHGVALQRLLRSRPLAPSFLVADDEWPVDALHTLALASHMEARASHAAIPKVALQQVLAYVGRLEAEIARFPVRVSQLERAAMIRSAAKTIVSNVEGFTGELAEEGLFDRYVEQAVREISAVTRRLAPPSQAAVHAPVAGETMQ